MWWGNDATRPVDLYCQIEKERFVFKMYIDKGYDGKNPELREKLCKEFESIVSRRGLTTTIHRPKRRPKSFTSTSLLVVEPKNYLGIGTINFDAIEETFSLYESIIAECRERCPNIFNAHS